VVHGEVLLEAREHLARDEPTSTRRAARKAKGGRRRLATEWVVIPLIIVLVFVLVFGLRFLVG